MVHYKIKSSRFCPKSNVANTASHRPERPSQYNFLQACQSGHDPAAFLQPAEHTFNNVALPVLGTIKEPQQPPVLVCVSCCADESLAASDIGRNSGVMLQCHSFYPLANIGIVCGDDPASWVYRLRRVTDGRKRYRWLVHPIIETSVAHHWNRTAYVSSWSSRPGCARVHDVSQAHWKNGGTNAPSPVQTYARYQPYAPTGT